MSYKQQEMFVKSGLLHLWTESFGDICNPLILLIFGSGGQGIMWPDNFCHQLAQSGFFVIRYDHRDTGLSSKVNYNVTPYNLDDLTKDIIAILDAYKISKAHIVGASMGGFIGQLLAINYSDRISSLTCAASSSYKAIVPSEYDELVEQPSTLPPPTKELLDFFIKESTQQPIVNLNDYIKKETRILYACNAQGEDFDENIIRLQTQRAFSRIKNLSDLTYAENHSHAIKASRDRTSNLKKITVPTLVIHGDKDPLLPLEHGIAIAHNVPNAKLIIIENMGHIFPFKRCDYFVELIINHVMNSRLL